MSEELKACAHCGSADISLEKFDEDHSRDFVMCNGCGLQAQRNDCDADPVEVWNRRATPPSPSTAEDEMPPLPNPAHYDRVTARMSGLGSYYSAAQMRAYGQECARAALSANAARTPEDDAREIAEIWDSAKAEAAMYVEAHCVDGEMHAEYIMQQPRPQITPSVRVNAADSEAKERDAARYRALVSAAHAHCSGEVKTAEQRAVHDALQMLGANHDIEALGAAIDAAMKAE